MARKIEASLELDIAEAYRLGKLSPSAIAAQYGVSRQTVFHVAQRAGIARTNTDAQRLRNTQMTLHEKLTRLDAIAKAHAIRRGAKDTSESIIQRAKTREERQLFVGRGERSLAAFFRKLGHQATLQKAVHHYNIDIAVDENIAVEIAFSNRANPLMDAKGIIARKVEDLLQRGWHVLYIMGYNGRFARKRWKDAQAITEAGAYAIMHFVKLAKRHPPTLREYRVIRCTGELLSTRQLDLDHRP